MAKSTLFGFMVLLRRYHLRVMHTVSPATTKPLNPPRQIPHIRAAVELKQVPLEASQSLAGGIPGLPASANQFTGTGSGGVDNLNDGEELGSLSIQA